MASRRSRGSEPAQGEGVPEEGEEASTALSAPEQSEEIAPATEPDKRLPEAWAKKLGKVGADPGLSINGKPRPAPFNWEHAAADQIHGWSKHKLHTADPFLLERSDYEAALQAAQKPDQSGQYQAHPGALSPFKNKG